jgi:hypothetical protein
MKFSERPNAVQLHCALVADSGRELNSMLGAFYIGSPTPDALLLALNFHIGNSAKIPTIISGHSQDAKQDKLITRPRTGRFSAA